MGTKACRHPRGALEIPESKATIWKPLTGSKNVPEYGRHELQR